MHEIYGLKTELTVRRSVLHKANNYLITVGSQPKLARRAGGPRHPRRPNTTSRTASTRGSCARTAARSATCAARSSAAGSSPTRTATSTSSSPRRRPRWPTTSWRSWRASSIDARVTQRRGAYAVYLKGAEPIVTFLALVGAHRALLRTEDVRIIKGMRNDVNRLVNAETANLQKSADAAMDQLEDIRRLSRDARTRQPAAGAARARRASARASGREPAGAGRAGRPAAVKVGGLP